MPKRPFTKFHDQTSIQEEDRKRREKLNSKRSTRKYIEEELLIWEDLKTQGHARDEEE